MTITTGAVRVDSPAALVANLPHLVGFVPTESAVFVLLDGSRVVVTQRVDVEALNLDADRLADLIPPTVRTECTDVAVVLWSDRIDAAACLDTLATITDGLDVRDVIAVTAGGSRWRSILCEDPACCPADGTPVDPVHAVEMVGLGSAPLPSREALADEWPTSDADRLAPHVVPSADVETYRDDALDEWREALDYAEDAGSIEASDARWLAGSLADVRVRDTLIWKAARSEVEPTALAATVHGIAAHVPALDRAPLAAVAAVCEYFAGDGARTLVALDVVAESAEPDYSLAALVRTAVSGGLPPTAFRDALRSLPYSTVRHGS